MVDQIIIERILADIRTNIKLLQEAQDIDWVAYQRDTRSRRFVERTLHILIEACIDLAQHIIADERMREPLSYRDSFKVLVENGVLGDRNLPIYERMAAFRNLIVHYYDRVEDETVFGVFKQHLDDFELFVSEILHWLLRHEQTGSK